ncbi:chloride channel protein [Candidatus Manganitrophus noduliformans]|uniref:Voltage-gated chloride channel n=1 Tax=Candidatus Manganitrophus noduliformans TaxID=2606439 RepID=A0A7X6DQ84_9BACT|nr:chloride channel protein [Candidatus Manganitrophus noduliformans]NKE71224.1 voltage-gated chloride channel [Candidatus Manganitrophus noduliformans]
MHTGKEPIDDPPDRSPQEGKTGMPLHRRIILEQGTLLLSLLKWTALAAFVGALVGASTALFLTLLQRSIDFAGGYSYFFLLLPAALFLSSLLVQRFAPQAEGHGTEKVIWAIHKQEGRIDPRVVPIKLLATIITIASGGSAGKEGPCAQIGAGLASVFSNLIRLSPYDRKKLVICGIAGGFAGVFGTPIAGALFAVEVLFLGQLLYDVLYPSFVAGVVAYHVTTRLGITYFHHTVTWVPALDELVFLKVLLSGLFFGAVALLLVLTLEWIERSFKQWRIWKPWRAAAGGLLLVALTMVAGKAYLGLGLSGMEQAVQGEGLPPGAFLWKTLTTAVTLGSGGSGGILSPVFFIGAAAGDLWGQMMSMDRGTFAAIGMVAVLAGATNTPIAASVMAIELFGPLLASYAAVACVTSFLITGHRSVYPSQIIGVAKSESIQVDLESEIGQVVQIRRIARPQKLLFFLSGLYHRLRKSGH